jgi:hypothetical protein
MQKQEKWKGKTPATRPGVKVWRFINEFIGFGRFGEGVEEKPWERRRRRRSMVGPMDETVWAVRFGERKRREARKGAGEEGMKWEGKRGKAQWIVWEHRPAWLIDSP